MKRMLVLLSTWALLEGSAFAAQGDPPADRAKTFKVSKKVVSVKPHSRNVAKPASAVGAGAPGAVRPLAARAVHSAIGGAQ